MKRSSILAAAALAIVGSASAFFFWPARLPAVSASPAQPVGPALIARGEYLAKAADCVACHTAPGGRPFAGGRAFTLPFGTLYAPNITPDRETGLGDWSDAEFVRAIRAGVGRHGEELYPALPYTSYSLVSDDDALAIRAYLASLAPVWAKTLENTLVFPLNQRPLMRGWKLLFASDRRFTPDAARSAEWNRGAYLARGLAHCGECHTPRNLLMATKSGSEFAGAVVDGWKAYNITPDPVAGVGGWGEDALRRYLATGHAEGHGGASGSMAEAVDLSFRHLDAADLAAIVTYLRSVPPRPDSMTGPVDPAPARVKASGPWSPPAGDDQTPGGRLFAGACASCHAWDGSGQQLPNASLRSARSVNDPDGVNALRTILEGVKLGTVNGDAVMPAFGGIFTDAEVAAVTNYVIAHFGGKAGRVAAADVKVARR